jgi:hypothetical protein
MLFAAVIIAVFLARCFRWFAKVVLLAGLLAWVAYKDTALSAKLSELLQDGLHAMRNWIMDL